MRVCFVAKMQYYTVAPAHPFFLQCASDVHTCPTQFFPVFRKLFPKKKKLSTNPIKNKDFWNEYGKSHRILLTDLRTRIGDIWKCRDKPKQKETIREINYFVNYCEENREIIEQMLQEGEGLPAFIAKYLHSEQNKHISSLTNLYDISSLTNFCTLVLIASTIHRSTVEIMNILKFYSVETEDVNNTETMKDIWKVSKQGGNIFTDIDEGERPAELQREDKHLEPGERLEEGGDIFTDRNVDERSAELQQAYDRLEEHILNFCALRVHSKQELVRVWNQVRSEYKDIEGTPIESLLSNDFERKHAQRLREDESITITASDVSDLVHSKSFKEAVKKVRLPQTVDARVRTLEQQRDQHITSAFELKLYLDAIRPVHMQASAEYRYSNFIDERVSGYETMLKNTLDALCEAHAQVKVFATLGEELRALE